MEGAWKREEGAQKREEGGRRREEERGSVLQTKDVGVGPNAFTKPEHRGYKIDGLGSYSVAVLLKR